MAAAMVGAAGITVITLPAVIMMAIEVCETTHHVIEIAVENTAAHTATTTMR